MKDSSFAIVGVSCRFAGCANVKDFWQLVLGGSQALAPLDTSAALTVNDRKVFERSYPVIGGQLGDLYSCVPRSFSVTPSCQPGTNYDIPFAVQLAFDALTNAGIRPHRNKSIAGSVRIGYSPVFSPSSIGWLNHTFFLEQTLDVLRRFFPHAPESSLDKVGDELIKSLPPADSSAFLSSMASVLPYEIQRECSLTGGISAIDSGGLTAFTAINMGVDDLRSERADIALVGAITPPFNRAFLQGLSGEINFSNKKEYAPFDETSSGMVPGEGGAFFVLKRYEDAIRSRDRIYATIRGVSCGNLSTAEVLGAVMENAKVKHSSIQMIEADGSGIPADDIEEVEGIQKVWGEHYPGGPLVGVGSVKGNIGHCLNAAASASILKVALSLSNKVLLPHVPTNRPISAISHLGSSAYLIKESRPWLTGNPRNPRLGVVLTKSFTGHRGAMILEEEPDL